MFPAPKHGGKSFYNVNLAKLGPKTREGSPNGFQKTTAVCIADTTVGTADSAVDAAPTARDVADIALD